MLRPPCDRENFQSVLDEHFGFVIFALMPESLCQSFQSYAHASIVFLKGAGFLVGCPPNHFSSRIITFSKRRFSGSLVLFPISVQTTTPQVVVTDTLLA